MKVTSLRGLSATPAAAVYPLAVDTTRTVVDAGSGPLLLSRTKTGHVDGCEVVVIIPANQRTKLYVGADINCEGVLIDVDTREVTGFDPTLETWVIVACRGTSLVATLRTVATADSTASTIISATVDVNTDADKLIVIRDKTVDSQSLTGLSLVGVSQTITSIVSVDGNTTTYDLSADFDGSEVGSFVVGATRTDRDLDGNLVAAESKVLAVRAGLVSQATWVHCWEAKKQLLPVSPGDVTTWTDQVGGAAQLTPGGAGHAQTTATPEVTFAGTGTYLRRLSTPLSAGNGDFAIYCRAKRTGGGATGCAFDFYDGSTAKRAALYISATAIQFDCYDGTLNTVPALTDSFVVGVGYHDIFIERVGTLWTLTIDARTPITTTNAATVAALAHLAVGTAIVPSDFNPLTGGVEAIAYGVAFSGTEKNNIRTYMATNYGAL